MNVQSITKEQAWQVRHIVMWPDKDFKYIQLKDDASGMHYGLFEEGELKSVVSLFIKNDEAQFRKFATLQEEQGKGYGSHLLEEVFLKAKSLGVRKIWCNARENKVPFYQTFNMRETTRAFTKSSTRYVVMELFF
ncbi:GNAT family N-acetyltransferase [Priestia aryabhattai]|uniref:GNAT family N-acetyltransferase n=1 Tax=Priestia megaterium TaxID=1404 RepID=UPI0039B888AF